MTAAVRVPGHQGTPAWLDARRDVIGSSDIPVITGSSPFRSTSLVDLWAVKTRQVDHDEPTRDDDTEERREDEERYWFGHALEPVIADRYQLVTGRRVRRANDLRRHPVHGWVGASLDREVIGERRIVEIKWVPNRRWATDGPEPVPPYVQDQVQWQLAVTGWDAADVVVLNGSHVEVHEVGPSERYQADLRYLARDFWDRVESGEHPPVDGSEATRAAIARLHPRDTLGLMPPTPEAAALAYAIRDATAARKAAVEEDGRLRNLMRLLLEEYAGVEDDDYRIHFRRSADRTVTTTDWAAVAEDLAGRAGLSEDALTEVVALHTTSETREGSRSLIPKFRGDDGRWS